MYIAGIIREREDLADPNSPVIASHLAVVNRDHAGDGVIIRLSGRTQAAIRTEIIDRAVRPHAATLANGNRMEVSSDLWIWQGRVRALLRNRGFDVVAAPGRLLDFSVEVGFNVPTMEEYIGRRFGRPAPARPGPPTVLLVLSRNGGNGPAPGPDGDPAAGAAAA